MNYPLPPREQDSSLRAGLLARLWARRPRLPPGLAGRLLRAHVPAACALCGCRARAGRLCAACHAAVLGTMQAEAPRCPRCSGPQCVGAGCALCPAQIDRVISAFDYADPGDLLIHRFKSDRQFVLAPMLAGLMADAVRAASVPLPGATILVPVPASRAALLRRGFNPAAELARYLARELGLACNPALLHRQHEGQRQSLLSRAARQRSVQHLYACPHRLEGANVAVVDDVLTTGSTLASIARVLRAAGAASVCGLVLARTPSLTHAGTAPSSNQLEKHVSHHPGRA